MSQKLTSLTIYGNGNLYKSKANGILKSKITNLKLNAIRKIDESLKNLKNEVIFDIFTFTT